MPALPPIQNSTPTPARLGRYWKRLGLSLNRTADSRLAGVLRGSLSAVAGRGLAVLINAALMPLVLRYLGKLEFGVWITISTSVVMLSVLDLGLANTLTNFIASAHAADDRQQARRFYSTAFWVTLATATFVAPVCVLTWKAVDWAAVFHLTDPLQIQHAVRCIAIAVGFFLVSLPLTLINKVLAGYQQVHLANYFAMLNSLLSLVAVLLTILFHGTLVSLMVAYCAAMLLGTLALNLWVALWQRPWLRPRPAFVDFAAVRELFGQGILFFIIQCTGLVVFSSDNLVITHYLGPADVTPYSFAWRLTSYSAMVQAVMLPSLWPAFSEAYHKRDMEWLRSTYNSVTRKSLFTVALAAVLLGLFGQTIIRIWAGTSAIPAHNVIWTMAAFNVVMAATTNQAFLLNATGRLRLEATVAVLAAIFNIALSIYLVQRIGAEGVILATLVSFLMFMIVPQQLEVRNVLRGRYLPGK
jgi:O-antigen/teichoic acid export membrane protein